MKANDADMSEKRQLELGAGVLKQAAQRELAAGVLKQAAQDLRQFRGATSKIERELYLDAYRWLTVDECSSPFSFLNLCELLNLAPENVRQELLGDLSLGAFSHWTRRCGRAVRRFRISFSQLFVRERDASSSMPIGYAETRDQFSTTLPLWVKHVYMKMLTNIRPRSQYREHFAVPCNPKLVGQWQRGIEAMSGTAQWKLHLTLAHSPAPALPTVNPVIRP